MYTSICLSLLHRKWFVGSSSNFEQLSFLEKKLFSKCFFKQNFYPKRVFFHFCVFSIFGCFMPTWVLFRYMYWSKLFHPKRTMLPSLSVWHIFSLLVLPLARNKDTQQIRKRRKMLQLLSPIFRWSACKAATPSKKGENAASVLGTAEGTAPRWFCVVAEDT